MAEVNLTNIIKHFRVAPKVVDMDRLDPQEVNVEAAKRGYIVHPDCCSRDVLKFIDMETWNPNSTFYKTWEDITSKNRLELLLDQLIHYASTYGTGYAEGATYVPNNEPIKVNYTEYTVIQPVEPDELLDMILDVLKSGIALSTDLLDEMIDYIEYVGLLVGYDDVLASMDEIKNKEAMVRLCDMFKIYPTEPNMLVRYLYYKTFNNPMVIASKTNLGMLYDNRIAIPCISSLSEKQIRSLATVFNRHKKFLLGLKRNKSNVKTINKISRLSKTLHRPMRPGFWENLTNLSEQELMSRWPEEIVKLDNPFKVIRLIEMINLRKIQAENGSDRLFIIRNGKSYHKTGNPPKYNKVLDKVRAALVRTLAQAFEVNPENPYVKFPKNIELNCPSSEKMFLGNLPFGSFYRMDAKNNFMGVYWRNEWGTHDFDLHYLDENGRSYGWNSGFYDNNKSLVFSGDMTNASPEAVEMFYMSDECPNGYLTLNRFNGEEGSQYRMFFGQEKIKKLERNYMVNPNSIHLQEMGVSTSREQVVGIVYDNKYYPIIIDQKDTRVSKSDPAFYKTLKDKVMSYLSVREVLMAAGFEDWEDRPVNDENCPESPALDLSDYRKDTLIKLFADLEF